MFTTVYREENNDPFHLVETQEEDEVMMEEVGAPTSPFFHTEENAQKYADIQTELYCETFEFKVVSVDVELPDEIKIGLIESDS